MLSLRTLGLLVTLALTCAGAGLLHVQSARQEERSREAREAQALRVELQRGIQRLRDRHERILRRTHEALLETHHPNLVAVLAWNTEHYLPEVEQLVSAAIGQVQRAAQTATASSRASLYLSRLERQYEELGNVAGGVAAALEALQLAVTNDDASAQADAALRLNRAERDMDVAIRAIENVIARALTIAEAQDLNDPGFAWLWAYFAALGLSAALLLAWVSGRLLHLARSGTSRGPGLGRSREEQLLAEQLAELRRRVDEAQARLNAQDMELERAGSWTRRAEHELALLKLYNDNLVNSIRSAIVVTDPAHRVREFNRAARTLVGLTEAQRDAPVAELPLYAAVAQRSGDLGHDLERARADRLPLRYESVPYGERLLDVSVTPFLDESGQARGLLWVLDDVTETVHTKNQLLAAERLAAVGRLSAQVAHEVRNPLSAIGLNAELLAEELERQDKPQGEGPQLLRAISAEIERLSQITEGYLQLARLPRPELRDTDLNQMVGDLLSLLSIELKHHGVAVTTRLCSPPPRARIDAGQLRQAMLNVVRNSREAMANGGALHISTRVNGDACHIEFRDTGPGIDASTLRRVFEPFYSTKPQGTGLGLSLTQQILNEHGGQVHIASGEGGGTIVTLILPLSPPD